MRCARERGFTLIELLIVIAIIGILSATVVASLNLSRVRARDAQRKLIFQELSKAVEHKYSDTGAYPNSAGWFSNPGHGGLDAALTPTYIKEIQDDPRDGSGNRFQYWKKNTSLTSYPGANCALATGGSADEYGFYAKLENPTSADLATLDDVFDQCVKDTWGMNYKKGN